MAGLSQEDRSQQRALWMRRIAEVTDGVLSRKEVAEIVGCTEKLVKVVLAQNPALPRRKQGGGPGELNHQFVSGRRVDNSGYAVVTAPADHPYARQRANRGTKMMFEHRMVAEQKLGRYLLPDEVVDHIDGLTLHNAPENLQVFSANGLHLAQTTSGKHHNVSKSGKENTHARFALPPDFQPVNTHRLRKVRGDVRLRQILLLALKLGTDSPYLLGTSHHTKKAGIDMTSRSTIELALAQLDERWVLDLAR